MNNEIIIHLQGYPYWLIGCGIVMWVIGGIIISDILDRVGK